MLYDTSPSMRDLISPGDGSSCRWLLELLRLTLPNRMQPEVTPRPTLGLEREEHGRSPSTVDAVMEFVLDITPEPRSSSMFDVLQDSCTEIDFQGRRPAPEPYTHACHIEFWNLGQYLSVPARGAAPVSVFLRETCISVSTRD